MIYFMGDTTYAVMWFIFKCKLLSLMPPPELTARFVHATTANPDSTYGGAVPDRLVCRVVVDPDAHHPHHPHQQNSVRAEPRKLAADRDFSLDRADRGVAAVFTDRIVAGFCSAAGGLLADIADDAGRIGRAHTSGEDGADS